MWRTIILPDEIAAAQDTFRALLTQNLPDQCAHTVGRQGRSRDVEVQTNGDLWYTHRVIDDPPKIPKHWNAFGRFGSAPSNIIVEVNIPLFAVNRRRIAGLFAKEDDGAVALFHGGRIGGGRKGIGQDTFLSWYDARPNNRRVGVDDDSRPLRAILVAPLHEASFYASLRHFVLEVQAFKEQVA
jgi:hypothetical protein